MGRRAVRLRGSQESNDFASQALGLIGIEEELGVGFAIEDDELFGFGRQIVLGLDPNEAGNIAWADVVAGDGEKFADLQKLWGTVSAVGEEDDAVNLPWVGPSARSRISPGMYAKSDPATRRRRG